MGHKSLALIYKPHIQKQYPNVLCVQKKKKVHGLGWKHGGTDSSADSLTIQMHPQLHGNRIIFFLFKDQRLNLGPHACWPSPLPLSYISQGWPSLSHVAFMFQLFILITYNKCILYCFMGRYLEFSKVTTGSIWKISGGLAPLV